MAWNQRGAFECRLRGANGGLEQNYYEVPNQVTERARTTAQRAPSASLLRKPSGIWAPAARRAGTILTSSRRSLASWPTVSDSARLSAPRP